MTNFTDYVRASAEHHRKASAPGNTVWFIPVLADILKFFWSRVALIAVLEYNNLRRWLARGHTRSPYWTPKVGDPVCGCDHTIGVAQEVSIRRDTVKVRYLNSPSRVFSLRSCSFPRALPQKTR